MEEEKNSFSIWIAFFITTMFILSCTLEISIQTPVKAIYQQETKSLIISWPYYDLDKIYKFENMKIGKEIYPFKIQKMSDLLLTDTQPENYQLIELQIPTSYLNNQVIEIKLLDKKEQIIKKIWKIVSEGG